MSGYNQATGVFELTATKASSWLRRAELPEALQGREFAHQMALCAALLREAGHEVLKVTGGYLRVKATPGQVWEALSGEPSDPEREGYYLR